MKYYDIRKKPMIKAVTLKTVQKVNYVSESS